MEKLLDYQTMNSILSKYNTSKFYLDYVVLGAKDQIYETEAVIELVENVFYGSQLILERHKGIAIVAKDKKSNIIIGAGILPYDESIYSMDKSQYEMQEKYLNTLPQEKHLSILAVDPTYQHLHNSKTRIKGIGSAIVLAAQNVAKEMGAQVLSLYSANNDKTMDFYRHKGFKDISHTTFEKWLNTELESIGQINANIIDFMCKHRLFTYNKFLSYIEDQHIPHHIFAEGCNNIPNSVVEHMLKRTTNNQTIAINKEVIEELVQSEIDNELSSVEDYCKFMLLHKKLKSRLIKNHLYSYKIPRTAPKHLKKMYGFRKVTDDYSTNLFIENKDSIVQDMSPRQIDIQTKILLATKSCYMSKNIDKIYYRMPEHE